MRTWLLPAIALCIPLGGCQPDKRVERIEKLQQQLVLDRPMLQHEAETDDPTRTDLKATYEESSIMQYRPTSNPERPFVAYVRIKWMFAHADGRPLGEAVYDYIYALDTQEHWLKADEPVPEAPPPVTAPIDASPVPSAPPRPA